MIAKVFLKQLQQQLPMLMCCFLSIYCINHSNAAEPAASRGKDLFSTAHGWKIAKAKNESALMEFFKNGGCQAAFLMTYVYDPSLQKWWSKAEITARFPSLAGALTSEPCDFTLTPEQISKVLGLKWPQQSGPVLLFFAPLYAEGTNEDVSLIFPPAWMEKYLARLAILDAFVEIPKYKVLAPTQPELR